MMNITRINDNLFAVDSETREGVSYTVNLAGQGSCSCPSFNFRGGECKHARAVKEYVSALSGPKPTADEWARVAKRAQSLSDEQLEFWLKKHQDKDNLIVAGAIRFIRHQRRAAVQADAELRRLFA